MSKESYEQLRRQYEENKVKHQMKLERIEEKRLDHPFNKAQKLMLNWPPNSPVNIFNYLYYRI